MKFSSKIQQCGLSPMRKFYPYEVAAEARGLRVHHLNIGQPDIETPKAFFDAVRDFGESVLAYAPAPGIQVYLEAVRDYYGGWAIPLTAMISWRPTAAARRCRSCSPAFWTRETRS